MIVAVGLAGSSIASGVGLKSSLLFASAILMQLASGHLVRKVIDQRFGEKSTADYAASFAVGAVISSLFHLLLVNTIASSIAWVIPLIVLSLVRMCQRRNVASEHRHSTIELEEFLGVGSVTLILLGMSYGWHFFYGASICLFAVIYERRSKNSFGQTAGFGRHNLLLFAGFASVGIAALQTFTRSPLWWTLNSDITFTEVNSQSFAFDGFENHLSLLGESPLAKYHWFPFVWSGLVHRMIDGQPWWVTTRLAHLVWVGVLSAVVWSMIRRSGVSRIIEIVFSSVVVGMVVSSIGMNFTAMFGVALALLLFYVVIYTESAVGGSERSVTHFLISVGLMLSKPQIGIPLIAALALVWILRFIRNQAKFSSTLLFLFSIVLPVFLVLISQIVFQGSVISTPQAVTLDLVSVGSFGELGNARNIFAVPLALFSILGFTLPLAIASVLGWKVKSSRDVIVASATVSTTALVVLFVTDAPFHTLGGYLWALFKCGLGVAVAVNAQWLLQLIRTSRISAVWLVLTAIGTSICLQFWPRLFNDEPTGSVMNMTLRVLKSADWIPIVVLAFVASVLSRNWTRRSSISPIMLGCAAALLLSPNPLSVAKSSLERVTQNMSVNDERFSGVLSLDNDVTEIRKLIQDESSDANVLASNVFCPNDAAALCKEPDWWNKYVKKFEDTYVSTRCRELPYSFVDWSLSAELGQFLIQGPQMFQGLYGWCQRPSDLINNRVQLSEQFGRSPDNASFEKLCDFGVSWFISDRFMTTRESWEPFGQVRLESGRLVLIKLDNDSCPNRRS